MVMHLDRELTYSCQQNQTAALAIDKSGEYPPKAYNSTTGETTATGELQNILPTNFYKQTITLNTNDINYGSGEG